MLSVIQYITTISPVENSSSNVTLIKPEDYSIIEMIQQARSARFTRMVHCGVSVVWRWECDERVRTGRAVRRIMLDVQQRSNMDQGTG